PAAGARRGSVRPVPLPLARLAGQGDAGQLLRHRRPPRRADPGRGGRDAHNDLRIRSGPRRGGRVPPSPRPARRGVGRRHDGASRGQPGLGARGDPPGPQTGGLLIVTTPNALSIERVGSVLTGRRPIVDHYRPAFGYGARYNREYASYELHALLDETG